MVGTIKRFLIGAIAAVFLFGAIGCTSIINSKVQLKNIQFLN